VGKVRFDRYTSAGLGAILVWSTSVPLARSLSEQVGAVVGAAAVHLLGGFLSFSFFLYRTRGSLLPLRRLPGRYLLGCGALFVLYMLALYTAVGLAADRHQALEVGLLNYLWPALTILFSLLLLGKKSRITLIPGTLLALGGVILVLGAGRDFSFVSLADNGGRRPAAYALGLAAAVSWALYSNLTRRWAEEKSGGGVEVFLLATGGAFLFLAWSRGESPLWTWRAGGEVLFLGSATALGYLLWDLAMRKGDVVFVAACSYSTPLLSTLLGCLYLDVAAGPDLWLGCLLIVAGSVLSWASVSDRAGAGGS